MPFFITGLAGLYQLQTRGYDGAGFYCVNSNGLSFQHKGEGLISDVFDRDTIAGFKDIKASMWLYETRYGTDGATQVENVQPIVARHVLTGETFAVVHNGQFSGEKGFSGGNISDTRIFANQLAESTEDLWDKRILMMQKKKRGAWSAIVATSESLYLMRDKYGVRPLAYGKKKNFDDVQDVWIAASETSALRAMGVSIFFEVLPDSVIKISKKGVEELQKSPEETTVLQAACIFENIYIGDGRSAIHLPRATDTEINNTLEIDDFRKRCGEILAREAPLNSQDVDIGIGVPGTGIAGGRAFSEALGIPYLQAITDRNPSNDQRTFMTPDINDIYKLVRDHFYLYDNFLRGLRVVLIDDSIVRANITSGVIRLLKEKFGVKSVHVRVLCPPIDKGCYLGINTRKNSELAAARNNGDIEGIRNEIGADSLAFLSDKGLLKAAGRREGFCLGCMVNHYPPIDKKGMIL
ncbi:MAG: hypothetical protein Q8P91_00425 [bacterium]|nr:hypothetical protein [bacterium]